MNHHHGAYTLPVELLSLVFDSLSIGEILVASHVSTYWRSVAHSHPTFWREVDLESASPAARDFFHARLSAGACRTVTVSISVPHVEFSSDIRTVVFDAVARNLYRIDSLYIEIPIEADEEMYTALNRPAPCLHALDICVLDDTRTSEALPIDLFACQAPRLRYVHLANTRLHSDNIPKVFSTLLELYYCFADTLSFPAAVFAHCPALETLIIYGKYCSIDLDEDDTCALPGHNLRFVDVTVFEGCSDLVHRLPSASIPRVSISMRDKLSAQVILADLRGPIDLQLELEPDGTRLFLHYESIKTGMRRTILGSPGQIGAAYLAPVYVADDLVSRVETLHATSTCVGLLPAFRALAGCTRVAFSLAEGDRVYDAGQIRYNPPTCVVP